MCCILGLVLFVLVGIIWRFFFFYVVKFYLVKDLFFFGERGRVGVKDVFIKYLVIRGLEGFE